MLAQLLEGAPYALGMVERLRRDHDPAPRARERLQLSALTDHVRIGP